MKIKPNMATIILIITTVLTGLIAGLFYAYSCSVNPALRALADKEYLAAMQSINRAIQNPVFFATFMGTLLLLPLSAWQHHRQARFAWLCAASAVYAVGVFGVTIFGNVPLNEALDHFNLNTSPANIAKQRQLFEGPWVYLHGIRTIAAITSLILVVVSCLVEEC